MNKLPLHKASRFFDFGMRLRRIGFSQEMDTSVTYIHQNDYYIFGLVETGQAVASLISKNNTFLRAKYF